MPWNEPGKDDKKSPSEGPPDLDKIFKNFIDKLTGKNHDPEKEDSRSAAPKNDKGNGFISAKSMKPLVLLGFAILFVIWIISGIYIVSPPERAVVLLFGKYSKIEGPGPHWIAQGIQSQQTMNVDNISTYSYSAEMLTKDQNIVDVAIAVQYRIADLRQYLYNVSSPDTSLQQATASALRQVIGNTTLDQVLTTGRADVRDAVVSQLQDILSAYNTGIQVSDVALQPAQAPAEVKAAFDDAIKAQEDEQRYKNQAEAYANGVVPIAQGKAKRIAEEANAYQQQVILQAQGDVAQFNAVYSAYRQAPAITRERIYLTTMQAVLSNASKIYVDAKNNNVMYLPFDKWSDAAKTSHVTVPFANNTSSSVMPSISASSTTNSSTTTTGLAGLPSVNRPDVNPDSLVGTRGDRP